MRILQVNRNYYGTTENLLIQIVRRENIAVLEKSVTFEKSVIIEKHHKELEKERRRNDR